MTTPETEALFWNHKDMVEYFASKQPNPRVMERINSIGNIATTTSLDLGCGGGRHTQALAEIGIKTLAIDINPAMLDITRKRTRHVSDKVLVSYGGIGNIPVRDDTFELVVSTGVLHQAKSIESIKDAIADVARVCKKGSSFVGNAFVSDFWDDTYTIPDPSHPEYVETQEGVGMSLVSSSRLATLFEQNGFRFETTPSISFKQENTGPRAVFHFSTELVR